MGEISIKAAVIGGGAAGLMAAGKLCELGADVTVFEKKHRVALKLGITGKGRCNVTNNCTPAEFFTNVISNPRFLMSAINSFTPQDTMQFFENHGVALKTERGNRVFPQSDKAGDIVGCLKQYAFPKSRLIYEAVTGLLIKDGCAVGVQTTSREYLFDKIILCTGGKSYPLTGSDGDGYRIASEAGHKITPLSPSLVPIETAEKWCADLMGLTLKNVEVSLQENGKTLYSDFGELLFTHFGISGPTVLSMSSHMKPNGNYKILIDLKPALDEKTLDARLLSDFSKYANKNFENALSDLLPQRLIPVIIAQSGIPPQQKVNLITKEQRKSLLSALKALPLTFLRFRPIEEAVVTAGGIDVKEINPKTMESKLVKNLFFAGEIIDVDAYTGGFNLQIAFSTGIAAAVGAGAQGCRGTGITEGTMGATVAPKPPPYIGRV